jgi:hypothetical protein
MSTSTVDWTHRTMRVAKRAQEQSAPAYHVP